MKGNFKRIISVLIVFLMIVSLNADFIPASANAFKTVKKDTTLNWSQFLGNLELQGVSDAKTPRTSEELKENWRYYENGGWEVTPGTPIVVGDYVYCYVNEKILKINSETGKVEAATTNEVSLPQTGHKHSNVGIIGLGLATIASILGLAGTRKRKKN